MNKEEILEAIEDGNIPVKVEGIFVDSMGGKNPVYVTDSIGGMKIQFINSSNQSTLSNFNSLLDEISENIKSDDEEGEVFHGMTGNQIYWELVEEDSNGTLIK